MSLEFDILELIVFKKNCIFSSVKLMLIFPNSYHRSWFMNSLIEISSQYSMMICLLNCENETRSNLDLTLENPNCAKICLGPYQRSHKILLGWIKKGVKQGDSATFLWIHSCVKLTTFIVLRTFSLMLSWKLKK